MTTIELILLLVLMSLILILGVLTYRRNKLLRLLNSTRSHIARDLHDEIGATLSSISFYSEACRINLQQNNTVSAMALLDKIGENSRNTIHSMNDIVWMINPKNDQLEKLFERIEDHGKSVFISKGIEFYFYTDPQLFQLVLPIEWRKNLYLIIKEAINNIAKYAQCSHVELLIKKKIGFIEVVVKDNGIGFDTSKEGKGNGLINMRVRAAELGSKLNVESAPNRGTALTFNLQYPHKW